MRKIILNEKKRGDERAERRYSGWAKSSREENRQLKHTGKTKTRNFNAYQDGINDLEISRSAMAQCLKQQREMGRGNNEAALNCAEMGKSDVKYYEKSAKEASKKSSPTQKSSSTKNSERKPCKAWRTSKKGKRFCVDPKPSWMK